MLKRYKVTERAVVFRDYYVEAKSKDEARDHVYDQESNLDQEEQTDCEIVSVEEVPD